jgi:hypothetical protein
MNVDQLEVSIRKASCLVGVAFLTCSLALGFFPRAIFGFGMSSTPDPVICLCARSACLKNTPLVLAFRS